MDREEKIKFLKMGLSCLRRECEERPIFSPDVPSQKVVAQIKESLETGNVDEEFLRKYFPMAYEGVNEFGFFEYFFLVHNKRIRTLERYTKSKLIDWCTAYPAEIVCVKENKWFVKTIDGMIVETDPEVYPEIIAEKELKLGDKVILHRDKIHMRLNEEEFATASEFYNRFKREQE